MEKGSSLQRGSGRLLRSISVIAVVQTSATIATAIIHRRIVIRGNRMVRASCQFQVSGSLSSSSATVPRPGVRAK